MRTRLHALWLLRRREDPTVVAEAVGGEPQCRAAVAALVPRGLAEVRSHRRGGPGKPSFLTRDEEKQVVAEAATGVLATAQAVRDWLCN